jgi:hypothetical protein
LPKAEVRERNALLDEKYPEDHALVAGVPDDVMDKLGLVVGDDEKTVSAAQRGGKQAAYILRVACGTRAQLQELLLKGVVPDLLRRALAEKDSAAKQWAGIILASIGCSIQKYDKALCKANAAYLQEKKKIVGEKQLGQVIVSPKPIMETVRRELMKAEDRRRTLCRLKGVFGKTWRQSENLLGLEDYLPFMELPDFPKSLEQWWRELWPLIKRNNPDLLEKLRIRSQRAEQVIPKVKTSGTKKINPGWNDYRNEFRNALHTLANLRSGGVL